MQCNFDKNRLHTVATNTIIFSDVCEIEKKCERKVSETDGRHAKRDREKSTNV